MFENVFPPKEEAKRKVRVAIDFDGTITADYHTWIPLIRVMQLAGWEPAIVTWRPSSVHEEIDEFLSELAIPIPVVFCNGCAKRECYNADIWIDDNPSSVLFSLTRAPNFSERTGDEVLLLSSNPSIGVEARYLDAVKSN